MRHQVQSIVDRVARRIERREFVHQPDLKTLPQCHVAQWLLQRLPAKFAVLASPAERTQQTAKALDVPFKTVEALAPGASVRAILEAADWPEHKSPVVVVGHQPDLGRVAAHLAGMPGSEVSIKKGGLWWFSNRVRDGESGIVIRAVLSPDLL